MFAKTVESGKISVTDRVSDRLNASQPPKHERLPPLKMIEIMAVTSKAGSIHTGWSPKFFVILTLILPTGGSGKKSAQLV